MISGQENEVQLMQIYVSMLIYGRQVTVPRYSQYSWQSRRVSADFLGLTFGCDFQLLAVISVKPPAPCRIEITLRRCKKSKFRLEDTHSKLLQSAQEIG
jgi:hypothetical protein